MLAGHTLACGNTVGKIAQGAGVRYLVLTHHKPRTTPDWKAALLAEVAADFGGRITIADEGLEVGIRGFATLACA